MSLLNRPFAGNWSPNKQKIVQWTPDALVYLNGDTSLAGCPVCRHSIDIQQFVTSVSVDAGVDPGASTANITLSIPRSYGDSIFRDGNTLLRNGLEVHVYFRGYFPMVGLSDPNEEVAGVKLSDIPQYPYYPVFHGVVTQVSHEYASGYYSASLTCSGMLHFWSYMQIASNGAFFGARPTNSQVRTNLRGHVFTGMSPFAIIYSLYRDTAGAAAGVGFALQGRTNFRAISSATGDSMYSMMLRYWERRFMTRMYGLRMHGASGQLFTASQQAYLSRLGSNEAAVLAVAATRVRRSRDPFARGAEMLNLIDYDEQSRRILRGADLRLLASSGRGGARDFGVNVPQMQAFVNDISQWGQVNLFETTYESKLDIATQVSNVCGYEFYQDVDGDLVFKPPLYNLDTSSSRVYRLEPEDIISISFTENEPEATYCTVTGGPFQNIRGAVDAAEWGVRSTYYDYRLIAQFGFREGTLQSNYYSNARSAFYAAVAHLDRLNQGVNSASITIPMRPEIRPGFPVYIPHIDCFYYIQSVSHSFTFGSACTTTLNLVARRRKFIPPGNRNDFSVAAIKLHDTALPPRPLQYLDNSGVPRLLGFPNVVMALDPERINPLFYFLGLESEEHSVTAQERRSQDTRTERQDQLASNFAQILVSEGLLALAGSDPTEIRTTPASVTEGGLITSAEDVTARDAAETEAPVSAASVTEADPIAGPWIIQTDEHRGVRLTAQDLRSGLQHLIAVRSRARAQLEQIQQEIRRLQEQSVESATDETARRQQQRDMSGQIGALQAQVQAIYDFLSSNPDRSTFQRLRGVDQDRVRTIIGNLNQNQARTAGLVNFLINQLSLHHPRTARRDMVMDSSGVINDSATILEALGDRKASIGINIPGYYRYYSSAHPDPEQQGYVRIVRQESQEESNSNSGTEGSTPLGSSEQDGTTVGVEPLTAEDVQGTGLSLSPEQLADYVKVTNTTPVNGLNVRTLLSQEPIPTSTDQIFALTFEQRTSRRFGRTMVFQTTGSIDLIIQRFEECLRSTSTIGNALGTRLARQVEASLGNAEQTCGALVAAAVNGISGLVGSGSNDITSDDIAGGVPNNRAMEGSSNVTEQPVGGVNTVNRARQILRRKGNDLVQQVSRANEASLREAIRILRGAHTTTTTPTTTPVEPTPEPESSVRSRSDAELAERAGIPVRVMRGIRIIESNRNPNVVRFERHIFRRLTQEAGVSGGISIPGDSTGRATFDQVVRDYPQYRELAIRATSWGSYQVLGQSLLRTHPDDPVGAFDRNPAGVSDDLIVDFFQRARPPAREAANNFGQDPSFENAQQLSRYYNGGRVGTEKNARWATRFSNAYNGRESEREGARGRTRRTSRTPRTSGSSQTRISGSAASRLSAVLSRWQRDMFALFRTQSIPGLPAQFRREEAVYSSPLHQFSPVFPVSDAVGYEHYGTYQYGRGLSIEPGGNYERLMATDPFEYVDPRLATQFVDALRAEGRIGPRTREALRAIASDEDFAMGDGGQVALRIFRESGSDESSDRTTQIAAGLANYIMSDRDAVTKLPVANSAFRLADIRPFEQDETCECRGAEADLLLQAYVMGAKTDSFVAIDTPDSASQWVAAQMQLAADSWSLTQDALRGSLLSGSGRRSLLDSIRSIGGSVAQIESAVGSLEGNVESATDRSVRRLNELAGRF